MAMVVIVDTNVAVVANRKSEQASPQCISNCIKRLKRITGGREKLAIDKHWQIIHEYRSNLRSSGQPGVGDAFLKWVLTNWANPNRCDLVEASANNFPSDPELSGFDPSDRKFVVVALAHPVRPPILQAVDSKWWKFKEALNGNGVAVDFVCEKDIKSMLT